MAVDDWVRGEDGNIIIAPVAGWNAAVGGMYAMLRVQFVRSHEELLKGHFEAAQVGLTAQQSRELGTALIAAADRIEAKFRGKAQ